MKELRKLAGQTAIYGFSSVIGRLLNYLLVPLYTRVFSTAEYGEVTAMYAYVAFLVVLLTYGLETAFFRYSSAEKNNKNIYSTSLFSLVFTSSIFIFICSIYSESIARLIDFNTNPEYVVWFAWIIGLDAISSISFAKLRNQNKAKRFAIIKLINIFLNVGLNLFFLIYCPFSIKNQLTSLEFLVQYYDPNLGIGYIFLSNLIATCLTLILLLPEMIFSSWKIDFMLLKKMLIFSAPLLIAGLAGIANETIDRILIVYLLPENIALSEVGIYGALYKISILMTLFIQAFRFAADPFFFSKSDDVNAKKIYARVMNYFVAISALIFLSIMVYYDLVIKFVGDDFQDPRGKVVVPLLLLANLCLGIYYNLSIWFKLTNKTIFGAYISIFGAVVTISLNFILIPFTGFVGAAYATLICYLSMVVLCYILGKKHYPIPYDIKLISKYLFLMTSLYCCFYFIDLGMLFNNLYLLLFIAVIIFLEKPKKTLNSNKI